MKRVCWLMKGWLAGREQQHQNSQQWKALTILIAAKTNQQEPGTNSATKEGLKTATKGAANCCKEVAKEAELLQGSNPPHLGERGIRVYE
jgi:hypothetical protein